MFTWLKCNEEWKNFHESQQFIHKGRLVTTEKKDHWPDPWQSEMVNKRWERNGEISKLTNKNEGDKKEEEKKGGKNEDD